MHKTVRYILLTAIIAALLCICVFAADVPSASGIYNVQSETGFTLTPEGSASTANVNGADYTDYYANAEKLTVSYSGASAGSEYMIFVLDDASGVPTKDNIVYMNQAQATDSTVSFTAFPKALEVGKTYTVYVSGTGMSFTKAGTFQFNVPYTLGDVNEDGKVEAVDALRALRYVAGTVELTANQFLAADVNFDNKVEAVDALRILRFVAGTISSFT